MHRQICADCLVCPIGWLVVHRLKASLAQLLGQDWPRGCPDAEPEYLDDDPLSTLGPETCAVLGVALGLHALVDLTQIKLVGWVLLQKVLNAAEKRQERRVCGVRDFRRHAGAFVPYFDYLLAIEGVAQCPTDFRVVPRFQFGVDPQAVRPPVDVAVWRTIEAVTDDLLVLLHERLMICAVA